MPMKSSIILPCSAAAGRVIGSRFAIALRVAMVLAFAMQCGAAVQNEHLEDAASKPSENVSSLPEMLLIGDSIRLGYCGAVEEALCGMAEVKWPVENCQSSQNILISLARWRGLVAAPKVVHFNCGHWDAAHWDGDAEPLTSVDEYARNVRKIIHRIRRYWPEAKIVFATTTAMNPSGAQGRNPRTTESIRIYNAAAVKVAQEEGVSVNDLFAITEKWPASDYADYCHFTKEAAKRLGGLVANRIAADYWSGRYASSDSGTADHDFVSKFTTGFRPVALTERKEGAIQ